jgi:hypothetical protein
MNAIFGIEYNTFKRLKPDILRVFEKGQFVVINESELFGIWGKRIDALKAGFLEYGHCNFYVGKL